MGLEEQDFTGMVEIHFTIQLPEEQPHLILGEEMDLRVVPLGLVALGVGAVAVAVSILLVAVVVALTGEMAVPTPELVEEGEHLLLLQRLGREQRSRQPEHLLVSGPEVLGGIVARFRSSELWQVRTIKCRPCHESCFLPAFQRGRGALKERIDESFAACSFFSPPGLPLCIAVAGE